MVNNRFILAQIDPDSTSDHAAQPPKRRRLSSSPCLPSGLPSIGAYHRATVTAACSHSIRQVSYGEKPTVSRRRRWRGRVPTGRFRTVRETHFSTLSTAVCPTLHLSLSSSRSRALRGNLLQARCAVPRLVGCPSSRSPALPSRSRRGGRRRCFDWLYRGTVADLC